VNVYIEANQPGPETAHSVRGLDPRALIEGNTRRLREILDRGLATTEHLAFVARLAAARAGS